MFPPSVVRPLVFTDRAPSRVVVPTAANVTAPLPAEIASPCVPAVFAFTAEPLRLTDPFPVLVVTVTVLVSLMPLVAPLRLTPAAVPVVMLPPRVVNPLLVTERLFSRVVVPAAPRVTAPLPDVIVRLCVSAAFAFTAEPL